MESIQNLFAGESLDYETFLERAAELGMRIGDLAEAEAAYRSELDGIHISYALERGLERAGAKNGELVRKALDLGCVTVEDGCVKGLEEQLDALRISDPYLFKERETTRTGPEHTRALSDPDGLTDADFYRMRMKAQ